ncbi:MAG: hypothetical protein WA728_33920 [Xanthobacteraceae bacterium]
MFYVKGFPLGWAENLAAKIPFYVIKHGVRVVFEWSCTVFRTEDCLEKATECDEIARAEDQEDLKIYYRALAEHWRTLAQIAAQKSALRLSIG